MIEKEPPTRQLTLGGAFDARPNRRLFLGIWPDEPAANRMTMLMRLLRRDGIMPGKPVETDRLHLTLFHLGDFVDHIPPSLIPAVQTAAASLRRTPLDVVFDRIGGTRGQFLLRASDPLVALISFRNILGSALIKAGLGRRVGRPFTPHVTLSYDFSDAPEIPIEPIGWTVREFHLVESLLGRHRHIRLGGWALEP
jgi:2'-5' RNA ligase